MRFGPSVARRYHAACEPTIDAGCQCCDLICIEKFRPNAVFPSYPDPLRIKSHLLFFFSCVGNSGHTETGFAPRSLIHAFP